MLLWLWRRLVATAPIGRLAWEPPYAEGAARNGKKTKTGPGGVFLMLVGERQLEIYFFFFLANLEKTKNERSSHMKAATC